MTPRNSVIVALLVLALLAGYVYFLDRNSSRETKKEAVQLLAVDRDQVRSIQIKRRDGTVIRLEKAAEVTENGENGENGESGKNGDNGKSDKKGQNGENKVTWRLVQPLPWKAAASQVDSVLESAENLEAKRSLSGEQVEAEGLKAYGLDVPKAEVRFELADGEKRLLIGDLTPVGGAYYACLPGEKTVYTVSSFDVRPFLAEVDAFRDKEIMTFDVNNVTRLTLDTKKGHSYLEKDGNLWFLREPWDDLADYGSVAMALWPFSTLRAEEFVSDNPADLKPYGLDSPRATLHIVVGDPPHQVDKTLYLGAEGPREGTIYLKTNETPTVYLVQVRSGIFDTGPFDLIRKDLVSLFEIDVNRIELVLEGGNLKLVLRKEETVSGSEESNEAKDSKQDEPVTEKDKPVTDKEKGEQEGELAADQEEKEKATTWRLVTANGPAVQVPVERVKDLLSAVREVDVKAMGPRATKERRGQLNSLVLTLHAVDSDGKPEVKRLRFGNPHGDEVDVTLNTRSHVYKTPANAFQKVMDVVSDLQELTNK